MTILINVMTTTAFQITPHHSSSSSSTTGRFSRRSIPTTSLQQKYESSLASSSNALDSTTAADLPTAYEWVANARKERSDSLEDISWMDPSSKEVSSEEISHLLEQLKRSRSEDLGIQRVPLCPIDSVFISGGKDQLLSFVSPRNIQMVLDLRDGVFGSDPRFCAVLQAMDTNRVASVGTMLRIVGMKELQKKEDDGIASVIVKVEPEENVQIIAVQNPEAWSQEQRLIGSNAYLISDVQRINVEIEEETDELNRLSSKIIDDFKLVRSEYLDKDGVVIKDLPDFDIVTFSWSLPPEKPSKKDLMTQEGLWKIAAQWQDLCYAARKAYKAKWQVKALELCVEASLAVFGRMKYPIDRSAYPFEYQDAIKEVEEKGAKEFVAIEGLDPIITFQAMLSAKSHYERLKILDRAIESEKDRIEKLNGYNK